MVAMGQFCCPLIGSPRSEVINIKRNWILKYILLQNTRHLHPFYCLCHHGTRSLCLATLRFVWNNQFFKQKGKDCASVLSHCQGARKTTGSVWKLSTLSFVRVGVGPNRTGQAGLWETYLKIQRSSSLFRDEIRARVSEIKHVVHLEKVAPLKHQNKLYTRKAPRLTAQMKEAKLLLTLMLFSPQQVESFPHIERENQVPHQTT
ncbi:uncharacterized protein [Pocillopora verrucosa]|uniref:uncharacterized protein n=1 Tax=Pocillopora verrucosa TaxID=203993 RepID=UPI0033400958